MKYTAYLELLHLHVTVPLRELVAFGADEDGQVRKLRRIPAERLVQRKVLWRGRDPFLLAVTD
jgi:hypothetical protein